MQGDHTHIQLFKGEGHFLYLWIFQYVYMLVHKGGSSLQCVTILIDMVFSCLRPRIISKC
jgi:hypothetical protein